MKHTPLEQAKDTFKGMKDLLDGIESYDEMGTEEAYGASWRTMFALGWAIDKIEALRAEFNDESL